MFVGAARAAARGGQTGSGSPRRIKNAAASGNTASAPIATLQPTTASRARHRVGRRGRRQRARRRSSPWPGRRSSARTPPRCRGRRPSAARACRGPAACDRRGAPRSRARARRRSSEERAGGSQPDRPGPPDPVGERAPGEPADGDGEHDDGDGEAPRVPGSRRSRGRALAGSPASSTSSRTCRRRRA